MSEGAIVIIIGQVITLIGIIINAFTCIRNGNKLTELHLSVNSRLDKLVSAEKGLSFSEGVAKGTADERQNPREPKS
jgi:hypothetical protein